MGQLLDAVNKDFSNTVESLHSKPFLTYVQTKEELTSKGLRIAQASLHLLWKAQSAVADQEDEDTQQDLYYAYRATMEDPSQTNCNKTGE
jgi:predicted nucleotidyltransferase